MELLRLCAAYYTKSATYLPADDPDRAMVLYRAAEKYLKCGGVS